MSSWFFKQKPGTFVPILINDKWIKSQIESQGFNGKSDVINDLIRKEQDEIEYIRAKLTKSEKSASLTNPVTKFLQDLWRIYH